MTRIAEGADQAAAWSATKTECNEGERNAPRRSGGGPFDVPCVLAAEAVVQAELDGVGVDVAAVERAEIGFAAHVEVQVLDLG